MLEDLESWVGKDWQQSIIQEAEALAKGEATYNNDYGVMNDFLREMLKMKVEVLEARDTLCSSCATPVKKRRVF